MESLAKEADGLFADVGITSKSNTKRDNVSMAQIAQWQERGWTQRVTPKQVGFFRYNFGISLKKNGVLHLPPRPFLTLTAKKEMPRWLSLYRQAITKGKMRPREALQLVAQEAVTDVRKTILNGGVGGKRFAERSPMTMEILRQRTKGKRAQPDAGMATSRALFATGGLLNSISYLIHKRLSK